MRVGITLDVRRPPWVARPWKELWEDCLWFLVEAEAMGFDALLTKEHFFTSDGYAPSQPVFLTALAERTTRARLGAYVYVLPLHNPLALAQEIAVLDHWSDGRLDVVVGGGHRVEEFRAFGLDPRSRPSRMDEGIEILLKAWKGEPFDHAGRHHSLDGVVVQPSPLQSPHPPLWCAATTPTAAERAGRYGLNLAAATVEESAYGAYRSALRGHPNEGSTRISNPWSVTVTDEDPEVVWERNRRCYQYRWDFYSSIRGEMGDPELSYGLEAPAGDHEGLPGDGSDRPDRHRDKELIGTAQVVLDTLVPMIERLQLTDVVISGPAAGIDLRGEGYEALKRFADEVLPTLKDIDR